MNESVNRHIIWVFALGFAGLLIVGLAWLSGNTANASMQSLSADYQAIGAVNFEWASTGTIDTARQTTVMTSTALSDLGTIEMGLWLAENNGAMSGFVNLDSTLVFTGEHNINLTVGMSTTQELVGPSVSGSRNGPTLELRSERFALTTQSGQTVQRQFSLSGTVADNQYTGEYRETVWGYGLEPQTIVGTFALTMVSSPQLVPTQVELSQFTAHSNQIRWVILMSLAALLVITCQGWWRQNRRLNGR